MMNFQPQDYFGNGERELVYALAEADAIEPPSHLVGSLLAAAARERPPGQSTPAPAAIAPREIYARTVRSFERLFGELSDYQWRLPALRSLTVQELVGHLIGVEHDFHSQMGEGTDRPVITDHIVSTEPFARRQSSRPYEETIDEWRQATGETLQLLANEEALRDRVIDLYGICLPIDQWLVVRAFEMWTHEEDISRAIGRLLKTPEPSCLASMTRLAMDLLPFGVAAVGSLHEGGIARIVLTGPGGGTWMTPLGQPHRPVDSSKNPSVRIVMPAVDYCRLVANRIDPLATGAVVGGDFSFAEALFAGAASLALD